MIVPEDEGDYEEDGNEDEGKQRESERIDLRSPCHTFTCGTLLCETHFCDVTHLTSHSALWEHPMLLCAFGNVYTWLTSFSSWVKLSAQGGRQTCHVGISLGILSPWPSPSALRLGACVGGGRIRYVGRHPFSFRILVGSTIDCFIITKAEGKHFLWIF